MNTLFNNAYIVTPNEVIRGCLGVSENRIAFVGEVPEGFSAQRVVDCGGNILAPGLVNTHTHIPMVLFRSSADDMPLQQWLEEKIFPLEAQLDEDSAYWGAMLAAAELIRGGVTCINDMYYFSDKLAEAMSQAGMRALLSRCVMSGDDDGVSRLDEAIAFHKRWNGTENDRIRVSIAPHAEYTCSHNTLIKCFEAAQNLGAKYHIHCSETHFEHEDCKERNGGLTPVALMDKLGVLSKDSLLAHCVHVELDDIARMAAKGATALHNPQSNLKLGSGIAPVPLMLAHKVNVSLGTDGAASNNNQDMFEEMRLAATLHKGVTNNATTVTTGQAFSMATVVGSRALGFNSGALEAGRVADIIMIDSHSAHMLPHTNTLSLLVYSAQSLDVLLTMVDGRILYERGEYYSLDMDLIASKAQQIYDRLT